MATAYSADTYADMQVDLAWSVAGTFIRPFSFNIGTNTANVGFVINDTVNLCPIPYKNGVLVVGYEVEIPSLDTGTSVRVSLGDTNGTAGAFNATFAATLQIGANGAGVFGPIMSYDATTVRAPVRGVMPKQYSISTLYSGYTAWPTINFQLKVTTAPNTATTTGTIKGWLMLQHLNSSAVTF